MAESTNGSERSERVPRARFGGVLQAIVLAVLLAVGWFMRGLMPARGPSGPPLPGAGGSPRDPTVVAAQVDEGPTEAPQEHVGHVEAMRNLSVCAQIPGILDAVHFSAGSRIEENALLFTICRDQYAARVALAEAGMLQAKSGLAAAQAAHSVAEADLVATAADLDGSKANLTAADAGLEAAKAGREAAEANIDRARKFLKRVQDADERSISQADLDAALNDFLQCQAGVARSKAQVAQATAGTIQAQAAIRQVEGRLAQSRARLVQAKTGIDQARAAIEQATANLRLAQIDLGYTEIRSPIAGRIGKALVTKGNLVGPSTGPLAQIVQTDPVRVTFAMTDRAYLDMLQAAGSGPHLEIALRLPNGTLYAEPGVWDHANNEMDPRTANLAIRLRFGNPEGLLIPHSYVTVLLGNRDSPRAPQVPVEAVVADESGHCVFVVNAADTVEQRRVVLGDVLGNQQCIRSGVAVGERVVVGGLQKVSAGQKVLVSELGNDGGA